MSAFLRLFGGLRLEAEGLAPSGRALQKKRLALLALLGAAPTTRFSREKLTALLWPEADTERARHQLAAAVYDLRKALGDTAIVSTGDELILDRASIRVDVRDFQDALAMGDRERAAGIYAGPLLDGFFVADAPDLERWIDTERSRLAQTYARIVEELAKEASGRGEPLRAVEWWRTLAIQDPYNSRVAAGIISTLDAAGDRAGALRHARVHSELLAGELGVEPDREVTALVERLKASAQISPVRADGVGARGAGIAPPLDATRATSPVDERPSVTDAEVNGEVLAHAAPIAMESPRPASRRRRPIMAIVIVASLVLILLSVKGGWAWMRGHVAGITGRATTTHGQPVVLMMDSPHPSRVYDEEVIAGSGTNADVLNDLLRDLPIQRVKETAGPLWHRHEEIRQLNPDLVLIHLSAFCTETCEPDRVKMRRFIEYLADTDAQILIYSRMPADTLAASFDAMMGDLPERFPGLASRVHTFSLVQYGPPLWKDPATSTEFKLRVKELLGLR